MKIKFSCDAHLLGVIPNPVSAIKAAPNYFKALKPQSSNHPSSGTVKRCVPFLDALSAGFVIPMWCDVYILARNGEMSIDFPLNFPQRETLGSHSSVQISKHPLSSKPYGNMPMKWINPWVIETEPGVSCIFTPPLNHMETRFKLFDGVVDTDTYYSNINFPFLWTGGDGEFFITKGTPLVQVIPFRRERHELEVSATDFDKRRLVDSTIGTKLRNAYRDELWHGKKSREEDAPSIKADLHDKIDDLEVATEESSIAQPHALTDAELLHQSGYVVLLDLITQADAEQLTAKLREYIEQTHAQPDPLCPKSQAVHGMPASDELLEMLTPAISKASGRNLIPTYSYARMYVNGETLPKHTDRPACQYSVTLCLGMDGDPWPIFMSKTEEGVGGSVDLNVGDGVLYLGIDMHHWREPFEGQWQAQVFLHWVDADGPHADQKYDGRLALSHHSVAVNVNVDDNVIPLSASSAVSSGILEVIADDSGRGFGEGVF
jgi:hypothetical protein